MSVEKSGFVVSSKELRTELRRLLRQLPEESPQVYDVMKDLGLDCTLARKRRLPVQRSRLAKAAKRRLRLFGHGSRQRLYRSKVFPAQIWDHQHLGTSPIAVYRLRCTAAKVTGSRAGLGNVHIGMSLHWERDQDPLFYLAKQQLQLWMRLAGSAKICARHCCSIMVGSLLQLIVGLIRVAESGRPLRAMLDSPLLVVHKVKAHMFEEAFLHKYGADRHQSSPGSHQRVSPLRSGSAQSVPVLEREDVSEGIDDSAELLQAQADLDVKLRAAEARLKRATAFKLPEAEALRIEVQSLQLEAKDLADQLAKISTPIAAEGAMASSSRPRGEKDRPPSAKPPKVNTTWEKQTVLAAKLRDMGVTCRACLEGPWYHKPHDAGETCYKHKLSMGTLSSPLSIAALRKKGDVTPARASDCGNVEGESKASRDASRPLSEYVRFETKEGMALLYDPSPLDKWIGKSYRWDSRRQRHVETSTGDVLSAEDSEDFQRYVQRHNERRQMGNQADELVKLVATHNPAVEEELRIYIGRFPGGVRRLLAEGKKVYKQPVDKQRHGGAASTQTAELRHRKDKTKKDAKKKKGEKKEKKAKKDKKAKKNRRNTPNAGEMVEEKPQQVEAAAEPLIHEEVDWGSEGDDTVVSVIFQFGGQEGILHIMDRSIYELPDVNFVHFDIPPTTVGEEEPEKQAQQAKTDEQGTPTKLSDRLSWEKIEAMSNEERFALSQEVGPAFGLSVAIVAVCYWSLTLPVLLNAYHDSTGEWPRVEEIFSLSDGGKAAGAVAGILGLAALLKPLRIACAIALTPWTADNVLPLVPWLSQKKEDGAGKA
ncbi:hypothetical protein AK812_SmicGene30979 [Symbiodinium microadriaticum]|uniref:Uncharacterized protein n=1 Tax=Symbiodinium microadriaticum TaxID=2951 RepID=A0A1Q9CY01_SYMMI|nr:hypothetical protein AK812_SmicGene30979 [Symbiodinium microadriaticum]